jgi:hypothetical protein
MPPEEKANALINRFMKYAEIECDDDGFPMVTSQIKNAKHCALIAVEEIMGISVWFNHAGGANDDSDTYEYWHLVKEEIEKA